MSGDLGALGPFPPPAQRARQPGWRDPRLWIGVAIVAASVLVGVRVLAAADDSVSVWAVSDDAGAGEGLGEDDLVARQVRFSDAADLDRYFTVDDALPDDLLLLRAVGAGELLARTAIGDASDVSTVEVSLEVTPSRVPTGVAAGSVVDVYLLGRAPAADTRAGTTAVEAGDATPALSEVTVVDAPVADDGFAPSGGRQLVLAVAEDDVPAFYAQLGSVDDPVVYVARHG